MTAQLEIYTAVPLELQALWELFVTVGCEYDHTPELLAAICWRETKAGTDKEFFPKGPGGTGDWQYADVLDAQGHPVLNPATGRPRRTRVACCTAHPGKMHGRGHGLMQVDCGAHADWLRKELRPGRELWEDPLENIRKGAEILHANRLLWRGELGLAVVSYNRGAGNVRHDLRALPAGATPAQRLAVADAHSANGTYAAEVLSLEEQFTQLRR
jgi:hypothetical protein